MSMTQQDTQTQARKLCPDCGGDGLDHDAFAEDGDKCATCRGEGYLKPPAPDTRSLVERAAAALAQEEDTAAEQDRMRDDRARDSAVRTFHRWVTPRLGEHPDVDIRFVPNGREYQAQAIIEGILFRVTDGGLFIVDNCPDCHGDRLMHVDGLPDLGRWYRGERSFPYHTCPLAPPIFDLDASAAASKDGVQSISADVAQTQTTPEGLLFQAVRAIVAEMLEERGL